MKYPPPTPEELAKARALIQKYWPFIEIFCDDLKELLFQAGHGDDKAFEAIVLRLVRKLDHFMDMEETQFLNKEVRDVTSPKPPLQRGRGKVVRRTTASHPIFGLDDFNITGGEGIDDDVIGGGGCRCNGGRGWCVVCYNT